MRKTAIAVLLFFFNFTPSHGQSLACSFPAPVQGYSSVYTSHQPAHRKMCGASRIGLITIASGIVIGCTGVAFMAGNLAGKGHSNTNGDNAHMGAGLFFAGGLLEILGGGFLIGGGIHDRRRGNHISLGIPKENEIGLVYNF